MKPPILISILLSIVIFITACEQKPAEKKEEWAFVINFFSPDTTYYPNLKNFPFPDSLRFEPIELYFTNQNKAPLINDSLIIFDENFYENGQKKCCKKDTLQYFIDTINGKKYLFAIGEYIAVFQSSNNIDTNLRRRNNMAPTRFSDIQLNVSYPDEDFKDEYEKLGAKFVKLREELNEIYRQSLKNNDSILVETIQYNNSAARIITSINKEMNETEVNSAIADLQTNYPSMIYKEGIQINSDGDPLKIIKIKLQGVFISFTQHAKNEYSFMMTDQYETIKTILKNAGIGYTFRDDIKTY